MCIYFFILKSFTIYFKIHRWRQCHWRRFVLYLSSPVNFMYTLVGGCHSISWGSNYWTRVGIGPSSITGPHVNICRSSISEPEWVLALRQLLDHMWIFAVPQFLNQSMYWPFLNYWTRMGICRSSISEPEYVLAFPQLLNQSMYWPFLNYWTRMGICRSSIIEPECVLALLQLLNQSVFGPSSITEPDCVFSLSQLLNQSVQKGKKVKSSMAKSLPVKNLLPQNVGSILNYLQ